jgi:hypothetical protein
MQIDLWPIERVKPYDRNPRQNDQAVDAVAASLKEFGWRQPIVVDKDGVIVVGHPLESREEARPGECSGPRRHGPDTRAGQSIPPG